MGFFVPLAKISSVEECTGGWPRNSGARDGCVPLPTPDCGSLDLNPSRRVLDVHGSGDEHPVTDSQWAEVIIAINEDSAGSVVEHKVFRRQHLGDGATENDLRALNGRGEQGRD